MVTEKIMYLFILMLMLHIGKVHGGRWIDSAEIVLPPTNVAVGTYSRSHTINNLNRQWRGDDAEEIAEDYGTAVATLALLDIGQGAVLPIVETLIDNIHFSDEFSHTRDVLSTADTALQNTMVKFGEEYRENRNFRDAAKKASHQLDLRKELVLTAFENDVDEMMKKNVGRSTKFLRRLSGVQTMFRVKMLSKALGPVFDIVNIGLSSRGLYRAITSCNEAKENGEECNYNAIASSSLCILSGIFGLASFATATFPPVASFFGIVSLLLGITSSIIDIVTAAPEVNRKGIQFKKLAIRMFEFDYYSRMQLEESSRYLSSNGFKKSDLYVINQGHLPNWLSGRELREVIEPKLRGDIKFGYGASYNDYGRRTQSIKLKGFNCSSIIVRGPTALEEPYYAADPVCSYNQEGQWTDNEMKLRNTLTDNNDYSLGPSFYGLTRDWRDGHEGTKSDMETKDLDKEYEGTIIMVNTNHVNEFALTKTMRKTSGYVPETHNITQKLRGLDIDTERNIAPAILADPSNNFNDVVILGDMRNIMGRYNYPTGTRRVDEEVTIKINTGSGGRDALNINGWVRNLDADLGSGETGHHNTLSFNGMSEKAQKQRDASYAYKQIQGYANCKNREDMYYGTQIRGVKFNPEDGAVKFVTQPYDSCGETYTGESREEHGVGHVKAVGILNGSPFDYDEYTLYALGKDVSNPDFHYTVFKFKGSATYVFDAEKYKNDAGFTVGEEIKFKIVDGTKDKRDRTLPEPTGEPTGETPNVCINTKPKLVIQNLPDDADKKNIIFKNNKIHIYNAPPRLIATISFLTVCPCEIEAIKNDGSMIFKVGVADLDTYPYVGERLEHKFDEDLTPNTPNEISAYQQSIVYLQCPESSIDTKSTISSVSTVILNNKFIEDCDIDDGKVTVKVSTKSGKKTLELTFENVGKFTGPGMTQEIKDIDRIVNEYGVEIWRSSRGTFDLFKQYNKVRGKCVVNQSQTNERARLIRGKDIQVWNNLQVCIKRAGRKKKKTEKGDFTREQQDVLCDTQ